MQPDTDPQGCSSFSSFSRFIPFSFPPLPRSLPTSHVQIPYKAILCSMAPPLESRVEEGAGSFPMQMVIKGNRGMVCSLLQSVLFCKQPH